MVVSMKRGPAADPDEVFRNKVESDLALQAAFRVKMQADLDVLLTAVTKLGTDASENKTDLYKDITGAVDTCKTDLSKEIETCKTDLTKGIETCTTGVTECKTAVVEVQTVSNAMSVAVGKISSAITNVKSNLKALFDFFNDNEE